MKAALQVSRGVDRFGPTPFPAAQVEAFRTLLLARMGERAEEFAQYSAALASFDATPLSDATGRDRAVLALRTFCALEAVEEIEDALARIETGDYGICQSCHQAIPLRRLSTTPQARSCAACPAPAAHTAHQSAGPRLGPNRGERTGAVPQPSPVRSSLGLLGLQRSGRRRAVATRPSGKGARTSRSVEAAHPSTFTADAPETVRRLLALAGDVLRRAADDAVLQRVARLRDELHVTANRVARFDLDEHPIVDPVRVMAPTAASSLLAPEQLVLQLELTAGRLISLLDPLTSRDWARTCRVGDRSVTLGALVHQVLDEAVIDLDDLLHSASPPAPAEVAVLNEARRERKRHATAREARRDAAAW